MRISKKWELLLQHRDGQFFETRKGIRYSSWNGSIEVEHPNGYSGVFCGRHTMIIYKGDQEVMHSGSYYGRRNADKLYSILEDMPEVERILTETENV